ncbi:hypothetical protein SXCC_01549 [Gluconacetobacter sp. SXCC-1]|nr:hypothetical protein SXCC_01549 [Gluconacetobacter sp. SXCC-1]
MPAGRVMKNYLCYNRWIYDAILAIRDRWQDHVILHTLPPVP